VFIALLGLVACGSLPTPTPILPTTSPTSRSAVTAPRPAPTAIRAATPTPENTATPLGTATPTAQPVLAPTLGYYNITPAADATYVTAVPTPVVPVTLDADLVNILLIGTDYRAAESAYRTDTLIVVSINKSTGLVTLLSIPRDLFVYIPTWGMSRINKAYNDGEKSHYPGDGPGLVKQTILYNLGIPIHYYALVNFAGFRQIVDTVGGIEVPVNCALTEYKIKDWALDESDPASYEIYTQTVGLAHMNGDLALWYARARPVGGDFFRSYRQRQVLRAIYHKALTANMLPQIPALYGNFQDVVQTDMGLWDVMQFAPLATKFSDTQLRSLYIGPNQTTPWLTPNGDEVLLPRPDTMPTLVNETFTPPVNQLQRALAAVEIWNGAANTGLAALSAETLANEGFLPVLGEATAQAGTGVQTGTGVQLNAPTTTLIDFTTSAKGSPLKKLQSILHVADQNVIAQPDASSPVQFRVILGDDYNACPRLDWLPAPETTPAP